ncbi:hypothetical protein BV898_00399 [Hypsibius exemplaris]|uniref:Link domain-containing protein n=1 Tax=Hypsibius exemplaris TaxID=2072580 RepID=A0A1W0XDH7_HYPEX|nr:hypothetical protein BV898_00399 [Hypsibius exemplaris]
MAGASCALLLIYLFCFTHRSALSLALQAGNVEGSFPPVLAADERNSVRHPLTRCPGLLATCCRFQDQEDTKCTFDGDSCSVWQAAPGVRTFQVIEKLVPQIPERNPYAIAECLTGTNPNSVEPAVFESAPRVWTRTGRDARLTFKYLIPVAASGLLTNITVDAVFNTSRKPVRLTAVHGTRYEAWTHTTIYLRDLGMAYAIRFTAWAKCEQVIALDSIIIESLTATNETTCLPTTTSRPTTLTQTGLASAVTPVVRPTPRAEVFHLGGYIYNKTEAAQACATLGAVLATRDQLMAAWREGASWCSSGWVLDHKGGFYPNSNEMHLYGCGTPGHYGVMGPWNSVVKLGANCFGIKPRSKRDVPFSLDVRGFNRFLWSSYDRTNNCEHTVDGLICTAY